MLFLGTCQLTNLIGQRKDLYIVSIKEESEANITFIFLKNILVFWFNLEYYYKFQKIITKSDKEKACKNKRA